MATQKTKTPIDFVRKLIRMRKAMNRKGLSGKPVDKAMDHLDKLIAYNQYNDRQAGKFFIRKRELILSLIPGKGCTAHNSLVSEFNETFKSSIQILNGTIGKTTAR